MIQASVVWSSGPFLLHTCPVPLIDSEARQVVDWFFRTHRIRSTGFDHPVWEQIGWPSPGALGDQDARLTAALDVARYTANALLREQASAS